MDGLVALLADATLRMPPQPTLVGGPEIAQFFHETVAGGDLAAFDTDRCGRMAGLR